MFTVLTMSMVHMWLSSFDASILLCVCVCTIQCIHRLVGANLLCALLCDWVACMVSVCVCMLWFVMAFGLANKPLILPLSF